MSESEYSLRNFGKQLPNTLAQYLEAQYHIWDESLVTERRRLLDRPGVISAEPYVEATPAYISDRPYVSLKIPTESLKVITAAASDSRRTGVPQSPYRHQVAALEAFFSGSDLVVSTGTGSGKTESFLMPIIGSLADERNERPDTYAMSAVRALLLYPMNALVNDQIARLRRLLGSSEVSNRLNRKNGTMATFGMYTSRTPYPGLFDPTRTRNEVGGWIDRFFVRYSALQGKLKSEGKWPEKDLTQFRQTFTTAPTDVELLTRFEMQAQSPDLLVTNYSMLEYMLLRPIDAPLFTSTRRWLEANGGNQFIIVLDEAHLYQGTQGTEVALLLRRLLSRLRTTRNRVRFILTSASLSEGPEAVAKIREFAGQLTGGRPQGEHFAVIRSELDIPRNGREGTQKEADSLASLDISSTLQIEQDAIAAHAAITTVARSGGLPTLQGDCSSSEKLRDALFKALTESPVAQKLAAETMGRPRPFAELADSLFPKAQNARASLDALMALSASAKREEDGRVFLPSRAHLLFRGLGGVYACINKDCSARDGSGGPQLLGKLSSEARLRCECGSRVFELLTHRDCGAAFLKAFFNPANPNFFWHESSTGIGAIGQSLSEVHLLVEHERDQLATANDIWIHKATGKVERSRPTDARAFLQVREPSTGAVAIGGLSVLTFDRQCPVCLGRWQDRSRPKIMDLVTKGEDPFAYLIATQVRLQPANRPVSEFSPNAGRKSLIFSDGRQKAARLARDLPRVIQQDAFRQCMLVAAAHLESAGKEARVSEGHLYVAFVSVTLDFNLTFFDGDDADQLREHQQSFIRLYKRDLANAVDDPWGITAPPRYRVELMRLLGSRYYSLYALGLGFISPRKRIRENLFQALSHLGLADGDVDALVVTWIQGFLEDMALFDRTKVNRRSRELAAGYPIVQAGTRSGFGRNQQSFLGRLVDLGAIEREFRQHLCVDGDATGLFLIPEDRLTLNAALKRSWFRCRACTHLSPVVFQMRCVGCGSSSVVEVPPGGDIYLRARKAFWRDPVEQVLLGQTIPITLDVQEHTAQLGYRDIGTVEATTESYERRFRDILLDDEHSIDVLSCTTTMEVGIDIGSLIAVGLRNMPPSRHNYQQRAGRAGRRGSAVSTVITFAQNNPHDAWLFEHPKDLIAGPPTLMGLDIQNPTLIRRHVFAEILQEYFEQAFGGRRGSNVFSALGDTRPFFSGTAIGSFAAFQNWLQNDPAAQETLVRIDGWVPNGGRITAPEGAAQLVERLQQLQLIAQGALPSDEEKLIEFLFARGVLPAYAFPRDLVALQVEQQDARGQVEILERTQQGAQVALSEYAPGRLVVLNKRTYRIGAVTANASADTLNRAQPLFANPMQYLQCPNCLYTADPSFGISNSPCPICRAANVQAVTAIQPEVVWPEGRRALDELDDDQTITDTTVAQLPVPASDKAFESERPFGPASKLSHGRQVPLIIMNRGELTPSGPTGFQVCQLCGYTPTNGQAFVPRHERNYVVPRRGRPIPSHCNGTPRTVYLGYEFRTDVLLVRSSLEAPLVHDLSARNTWAPLRGALTSLANAFSLAAASELDVDPRELQNGFRLQRTSTGDSIAEFYLYDTLAGGAGYSRLVGEEFDRMFSATIERLSDCDCTDSCTRCLRTYANRLVHSTLDRHLALDIAKYFRERLAPSIYTVERQFELLAPLRSMMQLAGWDCRESRRFGMEASRGGSTEQILLTPSLFDGNCLPGEFAQASVVSLFDIEKDLPSCVGRFS